MEPRSRTSRRKVAKSRRSAGESLAAKQAAKEEASVDHLLMVRRSDDRSTPTRVLPATQMSEAELLRNVIELAELFKWRVAHFRPGMNRRGHWSTAMSGSRSRRLA